MTSFSFPESLLIFIEFCFVFIFTNLVHPSPSNCVSECHFFFQRVHIFLFWRRQKKYHSAWWQLFCFFSNSRALVPDNRSIECNSMFSFFSPKQQNLSHERVFRFGTFIVNVWVFFFVVEHVVANLSMVLVRKTDDRLLSVIFFLCVHSTHFLYYTESCVVITW